MNGVPVKEILRQIRMKTNEDYGFAEFVSRKDIENIIEAHNVGQAYKLDEDDGQSVDNYV